MKSIITDINARYLTYCKDNLSYDEFVNALTKKLTYRAKTIPSRYGNRCACLIGLVCDNFKGDEYLLNIAIDSIHKANKLVTK